MAVRSYTRRAFARSVAAAVGLPLLPSLLPRRARAVAAGPTRLLVFYVPNGVLEERFWPARTGALTLSPTLDSLAPFRDRLLLVRGLHSLVAETVAGTAQGLHATATAACLTGTRAVAAAGLAVRAGISLDQEAASLVGRGRVTSSLELCGSEGSRSQQCEPGHSCLYSAAISWRDATTPLLPMTSPTVAFDRLFGTSTDAAATQRKRRRSILDAVVRDATRLRGELPWDEHQRFDKYLDDLREVERRVTENQPLLVDPDIRVPAGPLETDVRARLDALVDLTVAAFRTDATRVVTFMLGPGQSNALHRHAGASDGHHDLSHRQLDADVRAQLAAIDAWEVSVFASLLARLDAEPDGDGTLLDRTVVLFTSEFGGMHYVRDVPVLVLGKPLGFRGGEMVDARGRPLADLHLTLLQGLGSRAAVFGAEGRTPLALT